MHVIAVVGGIIGLVCIGVSTGWVLSYVSLSPFIIGGIIGSATSLTYFIIDACFNFKPLMLIEIIEEYISEEHQRILKEYRNSTKHKVKNYIRGIVGVPVSFGIGAGLATLSFISPAAIGAIVTIPTLIITYFLHSPKS